MKLLVVKDRELATDVVTEMLEDLKNNYKDVTDVSWEITEIEADKLEWEWYDSDDKGLSKSFISGYCKDLWNERGYEIDHVMFFFSRENWGAPGIGGWNLSTLYSNYSVQQVLAEQRSKWAGKTVNHEILHAIDDLSPFEIFTDMNTVAGVDWDHVIVHGDHPDWETTSGQYDFRKALRTFGPYIKQIYESRRRKEYQGKISKLEYIIQLITKVIYLKKLIASPKKVIANG